MVSKKTHPAKPQTVPNVSLQHLLRVSVRKNKKENAQTCLVTTRIKEDLYGETFERVTAQAAFPGRGWGGGVEGGGGGGGGWKEGLEKEAEERVLESGGGAGSGCQDG